jgi:mannose-6-phosphate isomerase-like protein (cupin superfamily)
MTMTTPRRVVTGHDSAGRAVIQEDGAPPRMIAFGGEGGVTFHEVWNTQATPAPIDAASGEPEEQGIVLAPPANGTRIRLVDFPPEGGDGDSLTMEQRRERFAQIGAADAVVSGDAASRHAHMHRTETIDYGIVLDGEIVLIMDEGETTVRQGDIVIQRGTNHAWANRSDRPCRVAFVLIDGRFAPGLN